MFGKLRKRPKEKAISGLDCSVTGPFLWKTAGLQENCFKGDTCAMKAKVVNRTRPRSYQLATENGNVLRRNRKHLLATKEQFNRNEEYSSDEGNSNYETPEQLQRPSGSVARTTLVLRRSTLYRRPPERLGYGENFVQDS
ncbi:hypothetical protein HPB47_004101 [Ixodes persulcatus]|uniref:Uncharacterized protein n=1 Tax=Ixodes persulcatus TaxID=34615 RepID=A0AC60PHS1_IXOPE|nr:hypothetical protein HPB47_004101 [Ixodes persulcatus]